MILFGLLGLLFISFIYFLIQKRIEYFFLYWFLFSLPTTGIIPDVYLPASYLDPFILFGFGFFLFSFKKQTDNIALKQAYRISSMFYVLQFLYVVLGFLRGFVFKGQTFDSNSGIFLFKITFEMIIILRVIFLSLNQHYLRLIIVAMFSGVVFLGFSSTMPQELIAEGYKISSLNESKQKITGQKLDAGQTVNRTSGLYKGHPTQFGAFMAACFGFFIVLLGIKKYRILSAIGLLFALLGIFNSGTRAALLGLVGILIITAFKYRSVLFKRLFLVMVFLIAAYLLFEKYGETITIRSSRTEEDFENFRVVNWENHIKYFFENPSTWFFGTSADIITNFKSYKSHSTPLGFLIYGGLILFVSFYYLVFKMIRIGLFQLRRSNFTILLPLIGYLLPSFGNDNFAMTYEPLMINILTIFFINDAKNYS